MTDILQPESVIAKPPPELTGVSGIGCNAVLGVRRTHLDLFSGIGGFAIAAQATGWQTIAFAETDEYASSILQKQWPEIPNLGDVRNVRGITADLITGGIPCQPYSTAGKRRGANDDRALWPEMLRIIRDANASWILVENVAGFVGMALDEVCADMEAEGYETRAYLLPACGVGAWHKRTRCWIVAHRDGGRWNTQPLPSSGAQTRDCAADANGANANAGRQNPWMAEPRMDRVVYGLSRKVDKQRIKALGNAIVPQVATVILEAMARTPNDKLSDGAKNK